MIQYALDCPAVASGEGYDIDRPTRQTELLSLELRKILAGLSSVGYVISQRSEEDDGGVNPQLDAIKLAIDGIDITLDTTDLEAVVSESISALSQDILVGMSREEAIYVYDKVVYSKSGNVEEIL